MFSSYHPQTYAFYYHWKTELAKKTFPAFNIRKNISSFPFANTGVFFLLLLNLRWTLPSPAAPEARGTWIGAGDARFSAATWPAWCLLPWSNGRSDVESTCHAVFLREEFPRGILTCGKGKGGGKQCMAVSAIISPVYPLSSWKGI